MVQQTVPWTLHLIWPPTPDTATLHFRMVPGMKSFRDVVILLDEQLSIATCLESESKVVVSSSVDAAMQVIVSSFRIFANLLFVIVPARLSLAARYEFVLGSLLLVPRPANRDTAPFLSNNPSVISQVFLMKVPHQDPLAFSLWLLVMYVGRSGGSAVVIMAAAPARTIVGTHTMGPISPSSTIII
jgi:hypothetical protein